MEGWREGGLPEGGMNGMDAFWAGHVAGQTTPVSLKVLLLCCQALNR